MTPGTLFASLCRHLPALLVAAAAAAPAHAGTAQDRFQRFFAGLGGFEAVFDQVIVNPEGKAIQRTRGKLQIMRPGRFRWTYESPYRQLIVTDGKTLWVYDPDLEQVTESALDTSVGNTPAMLLSTDEPLDKLFRITESAPEDGLAWVALEPRGQEANFSRVLLGFDDHVLVAMKIEDSFNQTVQLNFTQIRRNPALDPALFKFTPPKGADVIGQ